MDLEAFAFFLLSLPPVEAAALLLAAASGRGRYTQVSGILDGVVTAEASQMGRSSTMAVEYELVKSEACQAEELRGWRAGEWRPELKKMLALSELLLAGIEVRTPTSHPLSAAQALAGSREGRARIPTEAIHFQARNQVDVGLWLASLPEGSLPIELSHVPRAQPAPLQRVLILTAMGVELAGRGRVPLAEILRTMRGEPSDVAAIVDYLSSR